MDAAIVPHPTSGNIPSSGQISLTRNDNTPITIATPSHEDVPPSGAKVPEMSVLAANGGVDTFPMK